MASDRPILISPAHVATLGLDEALLISVLTEFSTTVKPQNDDWYVVPHDVVHNRLWFWSADQILATGKSLCDKGVLRKGLILTTSEVYCFAFNEPSRARDLDRTGPSAQLHKPQSEISPGKTRITSNWQPDGDTVAQLVQVNIPEVFARDQVQAFVSYWRDIGESHRSWPSKFIEYVHERWKKNARPITQSVVPTKMTRDWRPDRDSLDILTKYADISLHFVEDAIPEFILYWIERGDSSKTWNTKFITHVKHQWLRFQAVAEHSTAPLRIDKHWQPSPDVYDILRMANIDVNFAIELIPEFVLYWRESNQLHRAWSTRFLQFVKKQWALRLTSAVSNKGTGNRSTRDLTLEYELTDRSWV